jgi:hypothetical protein
MWGVAQAVECLPNKHKVLNSNPNPTKKKKSKSFCESKDTIHKGKGNLQNVKIYPLNIV